MKNILLIFGGKSYEHDISVVTAAQIYNKVRSENFTLIPIYLSRENRFFAYKPKKMDIKDFTLSAFSGKNKKFMEVEFISGISKTLFVKTMFGLKEYVSADTAILACHGGVGENGKLTAFLELMGINCSAGSSTALGVAMDKFLFKQVMKGLDIPTVRGIKVTRSDFENHRSEIEFKLRFIKFPVVIKQNNGGSSIGLFVANDYEEFCNMIEDAFEFDEEVLVEKYISDTREFNIAVIGDKDKFELSQIDEPFKANEVLSFSDKYLSGNTKGKKLGSAKGSMASQARRFPADIKTELSDKIREYAAKIFKNLGLSGIVRIDFLYHEPTDKLYVCEVNAIPGSLSYYFFEENSVLVNNLILKLSKIAEKNGEQHFNSEFITKILE